MLHILLIVGTAATASAAPSIIQVGGYVPPSCRVAAASPEAGGTSFQAKPLSTACTQTASADVSAEGAGTAVIRVTVTPR